ncbi:Insect pheromone-Hypothetical protein family, A10/OS-D [Nesidiocoris tenuis]|uniref:Uncharacterized protein n=1 Tax=Nesidiocoris tenuis TaxID=355587 RepID=A0ABN7BD38_9HEMI|nr:Insect pheromone-Hypothetical protein family, A10/OS-D [Nesidiocoris tenuis]
MYVPLYATVLCAVIVLADDTYTSKYDGINLNEVLKNERLYRAYFNCLANKGPCTREGKILKEALPEGLKNNCSKCTEHQKRGTNQVLRYLFKHRPEDMKVLEEIYDPEGVYRTKYADEMKTLMDER